MGFWAKIKLASLATGWEREGACGHSFDAAVLPPCNYPVSNMSTRYFYAVYSTPLNRNIINICHESIFDSAKNSLFLGNIIQNIRLPATKNSEVYPHPLPLGWNLNHRTFKVLRNWKVKFLPKPVG